MNPVVNHLMEQRNKWRKDPAEGFTAHPVKNADGTLNLFEWKCEIPGPRNTVWASGRFPFVIRFCKQHLNSAPMIQFTPAIFHPNVQADGYLCSDLRKLWPNVGIKQLLFAVQSFLETPNPDSALNYTAATMYNHDREKYDSCVRNCFEVL